MWLSCSYEPDREFNMLTRVAFLDPFLLVFFFYFIIQYYVANLTC